MDFLNKALAQLGDLFRSMTPAGRITAGLLLAVIVISVAYLFNHQFASADGYLFGGEPVAVSQLPAMEAAFGKKNLTDYEIQGARIKVPQGKQALYMAALADSGALPHNFLDSMKSSLDSGGMLVDRQKREELLKVGMQDELSKIVGQMTGIERATVLYHVENPQVFNAKKIVTASVTVKPLGNNTLSSQQVQMIRQAVGPAIGAPPESIAVVDINGRAYPGGEAGSGSDVSQDSYLSRKVAYEQTYTDRIRQALSLVSGAVVTVNVELNRELQQIESTTKFDPKAVAGDVSEDTKTLSASSTPVGGRPGAQSQLAGANAQGSVSSGAVGSRSEEEASKSHTKNLVGNEQRQVSLAGLTPKRVSVSVGVPSNYYEEVWQQRNPSPAGQTPKKPDAAALTAIETEQKSIIQKSVQHIVDASGDPVVDATLVDVETFPFLPTAEIPKPSSADHALAWLTDHASSLGMAVLVIFALLTVRSMVRSIPAPDLNEPSTPALATATANTEVQASNDEPAPAAAPQRLRRRRSKGGPSLRDELVEIVREDPDAAANILRSWIGSAN